MILKSVRCVVLGNSSTTRCSWKRAHWLPIGRRGKEGDVHVCVCFSCPGERRTMVLSVERDMRLAWLWSSKQEREQPTMFDGRGQRYVNEGRHGAVVVANLKGKKPISTSCTGTEQWSLGFHLRREKVVQEGSRSGDMRHTKVYNTFGAITICTTGTDGNSSYIRILSIFMIYAYICSVPVFIVITLPLPTELSLCTHSLARTFSFQNQVTNDRTCCNNERAKQQPKIWNITTSSSSSSL